MMDMLVISRLSVFSFSGQIQSIYILGLLNYVDMLWNDKELSFIYPPLHMQSCLLKGALTLVAAKYAAL